VQALLHLLQSRRGDVGETASRVCDSQRRYQNFSVGRIIFPVCSWKIDVGLCSMVSPYSTTRSECPALPSVAGGPGDRDSVQSGPDLFALFICALPAFL
jgi:hypothetical protein